MGAVYKSSDWVIYTYVPEAGSFILDYSQLDGSDVLGTTEGSDVLYTGGEITSLAITDGFQIEQGVIPSFVPQTAEINLQVLDFTLTDSRKFLVGNRIVIAGPNDNATAGSYGTKTPYFYGIIRSMAVSVEPATNIGQISITASTRTQDLLNIPLSITKDTTTDRATLIENAINARLSNLGVSANLTDTYNFGTATTETKTVGDWLDDLTSVSLLPIFDSTYCTAATGGAQVALYSSNNAVGTSVAGILDSQYSQIVFDWSGANSPTSVEYTLASNPAIVYQAGDNSFNGGFSSNVVLEPDVKDLTQLTTSGQLAMSMTQKFLPVAITIPIAKRENQIIGYQPDSPVGSTGNMWPELLFRPGQTININSTLYGYNELLLITGRTINVDYESFTATYNLWKGFTN